MSDRHSAPPRPSVTVAEYLAVRLHQLDVEHLFGVPGDFNLTLLDEMLGLGWQRWVGSPNELNAGYAADGYARSRGLAAVVTTYGVGELSCLNAIAGSFAEQVPVVQITGAPRTSAAETGTLLHHTLCDGDFGHFVRAYAEVTVAQEVLRADTAAEQIDRVLAAALRHSRPVYLSIPVDVVTARVASVGLLAPLPVARVDTASLGAFTAAAADLLAGSGSAAVVAGHLVQRRRLQGLLLDLVDRGALPVVSLPNSKGVVDEVHPGYAGVYAGDLSDKAARAAVDGSECLIHVGTLMSDLVSGMFTARVDPAHTIALDDHSARVGERVFPGLPLAASLAALADLVAQRCLAGQNHTQNQNQNPTRTEGDTEVDVNAPLTQAVLWSVVERQLPAGHSVLAEMGTPLMGMLGVTFPADTVFTSAPVWASIGYTLPATLGRGLAEPGRRPVLLIGDGSAQMTVQELSTIAAHGLHPVLVLVDNAGYTIERALQSPDAGYNDVAAWDWPALLRALAPTAEITTSIATTGAELANALADAWAAPDRIVLVVARTAKRDVPGWLASLAAVTQAR